jgi:hypothetical protein
MGRYFIRLVINTYNGLLTGKMVLNQTFLAQVHIMIKMAQFLKTSVPSDCIVSVTGFFGPSVIIFFPWFVSQYVCLPISLH